MNGATRQTGKTEAEPGGKGHSMSFRDGFANGSMQSSDQDVLAATHALRSGRQTRGGQYSLPTTFVRKRVRTASSNSALGGGSSSLAKALTSQYTGRNELLL